MNKQYTKQKNTNVVQTDNNFKPIINDKNANKTTMLYPPNNYLPF